MRHIIIIAWKKVPWAQRKMWCKWSLQGLVTFSCCVFVVLNQSCQSKVGNLTDEFMRHQNVGCSQVSMNVIFGLDEGHAVSHLQGAAHHQTNPASVRSSMNLMSVRDTCVIHYCVIFVCVGQTNRKFPKLGSLPLPQVNSLYTLPLYTTQVLHPGAQLCSLYFLVLKAAALPLPHWQTGWLF